MRGVMILIAVLAAGLLPGMVGNDQLAHRTETAAPQPQAPAGKRIAISFDDVPRAAGAFMTEDERSQRLIADLRAAEVTQAAFFVNPARINADDHGAEHIAAYVGAGHVIANHGFEHLPLSRVSPDTYLADIDKAEAWLKGRPGYRPWFRYPFLDGGGLNAAKRDAVRAGLKARGLHNAYVTVDGDDWNMEWLALQAKKRGQSVDTDALRDLYVETHVQAADFADALARRALGRSPAHVLLLHETDIDALFLPEMIAALRRDGWQIITIDEAYADPMHDAEPRSPTANGTLIEQFAWEKNLPAPRWYARNDVKFASTLFEQRVMHEGGGAKAGK